MKTTKCLSKFDPTRTDCHASNTGTIPVNITFFGYKSDRFFWRYCNTEKKNLITGGNILISQGFFLKSFICCILISRNFSNIYKLQTCEFNGWWFGRIIFTEKYYFVFPIFLTIWHDVNRFIWLKNHKNWGIFEIISKIRAFIYLFTFEKCYMSLCF